MKKLLFLIVLFSCTVISCKENSNSNQSNSIVGKWKLESMDVPEEATDFPEKMKKIQASLSTSEIIWEFDKNGKYFTSGIDKPVAQNYKITNGKLNIDLEGNNDEGFDIFMLNEKRMVLKKKYENSEMILAFNKMN